MSRSAGDEAHSHVGEGHVAVVGMRVTWRAGVVEKVRRGVVRRASRMHGAGARERRANVKAIVYCGESGRGKLGNLYRALGTRSAARMTMISDIAEFGLRTSRSNHEQSRESRLDL
jgi:hypothetical protein